MSCPEKGDTAPASPSRSKSNHCQVESACIDHAYMDRDKPGVMAENYSPRPGLPCPSPYSLLDSPILLDQKALQNMIT